MIQQLVLGEKISMILILSRMFHQTWKKLITKFVRSICLFNWFISHLSNLLNNLAFTLRAHTSNFLWVSVARQLPLIRWNNNIIQIVAKIRAKPNKFTARPIHKYMHEILKFSHTHTHAGISIRINVESMKINSISLKHAEKVPPFRNWIRNQSFEVIGWTTVHFSEGVNIRSFNGKY